MSVPMPEATSEPILLRDDTDGITTLRLNRPRAYNALSLALIDTLRAALDAIADDDAVRVVILAGAGKGFCAGHDLRELRAHPTRDFYATVFDRCGALMQRIVSLPKPVIAEVHGVATAAGCQLVATCDLALAAEDTRFAVPGVNIGLFCSTPMVALTRAIGRKPAMEMLLTGEMIDATTAARLGLINRIVPAAALSDATRDLAARIAAKSPLTLAIGKEAFHRQSEMDLAGAYAYTSGVMTRNMLARDAAIGIDALLARKVPEWCGR
jgi:enoyl-CoA hydratase/carnithine racemase